MLWRLGSIFMSANSSVEIQISPCLLQTIENLRPLLIWWITTRVPIVASKFVRGKKFIEGKSLKPLQRETNKSFVKVASTCLDYKSFVSKH